MVEDTTGVCCWEVWPGPTLPGTVPGTDGTAPGRETLGAPKK